MPANRQILLDNRPQGEATVDTSKLAVFGFCFGGCCALDLARTGAPVKAAVSFHGTLDSPNPADAQNIKGSVLVLHGALRQWMDERRLTAHVTVTDESEYAASFCVVETLPSPVARAADRTAP